MPDRQWAVVLADRTLVRLVTIGPAEEPVGLGAGESAVALFSPFIGWPEPPVAGQVACIDVAGELYWEDRRSLEDHRAAAWAAIKAQREQREFGVLEFGGMVFQADSKSQLKLSNAARMASVEGAGWSVDWTLADDSVATLDRSDINGVVAALAQRADAVHQVSRGLRAQLDAAQSHAAIDGVAWPVGQ